MAFTVPSVADAHTQRQRATAKTMNPVSNFYIISLQIYPVE